MTKILHSEINAKETQNKRILSAKLRLSPPLPSLKIPPLGNITSYFATQQNQAIQLTEKQILRLKYQYKKDKIERKKKIGKLVARVSYCGTRCISKHPEVVNMVQGEKGGVYFANMQRCGSVWFCPDCMYKLMKTRADELYRQLKTYNDKGKTVLFATFTIQHNKGDRLSYLHKKLLGAFQFANSHRKWIEAKKTIPVEYLRALEVLKGANGWHPHLHCLFVGDLEITNTIKVFIDLYKQELLRLGLVVNKHTVIVDKWNGTLDSMTDYLFKGMIEKEITGGNLTKSGSGKNFFELIDADDKQSISEYIEVMKGKRQYHHSKHFFDDVDVKTETEILTDDKVETVLFSIPIMVYADINEKGIALHFLNEYVYGGRDRAEKLLELYDCDTGFMEAK